MSVNTERTTLLNWENTTYSWWEVCKSCNISLPRVISLNAQILSLISLIATDIITLITPERSCNNNALLVNITSTISLMGNMIYLATACYYKNRYRLCNLEPDYADNSSITQKKCFLDTTICHSVVNVAASVISLFAMNAFCVHYQHRQGN